MEIIVVSLIKVLSGMTQFAMLLVGLLLAKYLFDWTTPYKFSEELTEKDNPAFGVCLAGYLIGAGIALTGVLFNSGAEFSLVDDIVSIGVVIVVILILMRLSVIIIFPTQRISISQSRAISLPCSRASC